MNSYNLIHTSHSYVPVTVINRGGPSCLLFLKIIHFCTAIRNYLCFGEFAVNSYEFIHSHLYVLLMSQLQL